MNTFCLCVVTLSVYVHGAVSLEAVGCYGNTANDFIIPRCDSDKVIAIDNLFAIAKKVSFNCPQVFTVSDVASRQLCCSKNPEDCVMPYSGVSDYHTICVGVSTCSKKVGWQLTTCSGAGYLSQSNYMLMSYQCLSRSDIISIPSNVSKSGTTVMIQNVGFPTSGIDPNTDTTCSVTTSCISSITVTSLHQAFKQDASGTCTQYVDVVDGNSTNRLIIDCANNTNYTSGILYTSSTHFITVNLRSNLPTKSGRLWMQFLATHYQASIEVQCGTSAVTAVPNVPACPETTTITTTTTPSRRRRKGNDDDDGLSPGAAVGLTIGIVLLVMLLLILLCVCCKKKQKKNKMKVTHKTGDIPDFDFAEALGITGTFIKSTAPVTSLMPTMPRRLTPIGAPEEGHERTPWNSSMTPTLSVVKHMTSTGGTHGSKSTQPDSTKTSVFEISRELSAQNGKVLSHDINQNVEKWKEAAECTENSNQA